MVRPKQVRTVGHPTTESPVEALFSDDMGGPAPQPELCPSQSHLATSKRFPRLDGGFATWVALALVIVGGTLPRLNHIDKSIWSAEAWVANSVLADSLGQMFYYPAWLQTTPPLFLLLVRGTVHIAGVSVGSLRAVPLGLSVLSLILIAWLSRSILRSPFAVLCTTLVALSPPAVVFSKELKQYSGDVAASCLVLLVLWRYLERPDGRRFAYLTVALTVALLLSYPAVTFIPIAIAIVAWAEPTSDGNRPIALGSRLQRTGVLAALSAALCGANYWLFAKPNTSVLLDNYWSYGYPRFHRLGDVVRFYTEYFLGMGVCFYLPLDTKDLFKSKLSSTGYLSLALVLIVVGLVVGLAFITLRRNRRNLQALLLCFAPLAALLALNLLHLYPVSSRRLTLFMLPCISLALAIVIQSCCETLSRGIRVRTAAFFPALSILTCVVIVFVAGTHADQWSNYWFEDENTGAAFRYLRSHFAPEDTLYIHASIAEPAKLYFRMLQWDPGDVRYGNTGWDCCPRNPVPQPGDASSKYEYVVRDFSKVMGEMRGEHLWLLYTARGGYWEDLGRDEPQIIADYLNTVGCRKKQETQFTNEVLDEFGCGRNGSN